MKALQEDEAMKVLQEDLRVKSFEEELKDSLRNLPSELYIHHSDFIPYLKAFRRGALARKFPNETFLLRPLFEVSREKSYALGAVIYPGKDNFDQLLDRLHSRLDSYEMQRPNFPSNLELKLQFEFFTEDSPREEILNFAHGLRRAFAEASAESTVDPLAEPVRLWRRPTVNERWQKTRRKLKEGKDGLQTNLRELGDFGRSLGRGLGRNLRRLGEELESYFRS